MFYGDFAAGKTIRIRFNTVSTAGVPTTLTAGAVTISKDGADVTPSGGVTLTVDHGGVTGRHTLVVDTSVDTATFTVGSEYAARLSGSSAVAGTSVVGIVVGEFSLANRYVITAATIWDEINTGATHNVNSSTGKQLRTLASTTGAIYSGTCPSQAGMTTTQIKLDAGASAVDNLYRPNTISITGGTGAGQSKIIASYVGSTKVATTASAWVVQPDATSTFDILGTAGAVVAGYVAGLEPPSAAICADGLLGRNIGGGSDGGRTVAQAMAFLRNKWTISGGTLTVFAADDSTPLWTSAIVTTAGNPVSSSDPA